MFITVRFLHVFVTTRSPYIGSPNFRNSVCYYFIFVFIFDRRYTLDLHLDHLSGRSSLVQKHKAYRQYEMVRLHKK